MARLIFPVPVFLNRLAAPLWVFILGIIFFSLSSHKDHSSQEYFTLTLPGRLPRLGVKLAVLQVGGTISSFCLGSCPSAASRRCFLRRLLLLLLRLLLRLFGTTTAAPTCILLRRRH